MTRLKPIVDPHAGQYQVVVSFLVAPIPDLNPPDIVRKDLERELRLWGEDYGLSDLDVAVRVIGADGEASEDEGRYDRPSALGNTDDIEHAHPVTDIQAEGKRL